MSQNVHVLVVQIVFALVQLFLFYHWCRQDQEKECDLLHLKELVESLGSKF